MQIVSHRRHYRDREKGSILMLGAVAIFVVMAFAGLALDASYMYFHKRAMQTAADAGAYGGALELLRGNTDITAAAKNDTALNGFTDGCGVTFFNTYSNSYNYGAISINGSGTVDLSAPTSGAYKGLLFYQDPTVAWSASNGSTISGGALSVYDGIIYFPTTDLTYSGNSSTAGLGTAGYTVLVGYNINIAGAAHINADYSTLGGNNPLQNALFAE